MKEQLNMRHRKKKFVPTFWFFDKENRTEENPSRFYCYWEEGIWDKYGLHYIEHNGDKTEVIHLKGNVIPNRHTLIIAMKI